MKKILFPLLATAAITAFFAFRPAEIETIAIGAKAPKTDLKMKATLGKDVTLFDTKKDKGLLVVFSCNTCPFVVGGEDSEGWEGRYSELQKSCDSEGIGMILVNSNEAKRSKGDNLEDMTKRAKEHGFSSSIYALDKNSELADAFGARTTPHVFLFDKDMKLVYKGAIDDNVDKAASVSQPYLNNALKNLGGGKAIEPAETRPVGCGIKRLS